MSQEKQSWWARLRETLSGQGEPDEQVAEPALGQDGLLAEPAEQPESAGPQGGPISRRLKKDQAVQTLQEGYDRLLVLIDSIQNHMDLQHTQAEQLVDAVRQIGARLQSLPDQVDRQVELMGSIASQLETTNVRTMQLADAIGELPKSVEAQAETLNSLNQQLGLANETTAQVANSLDQLGPAMGSLNQASQAQTSQLRRAQTSAEEHAEKLVGSLRFQGRLLAVLTVLVVLAIGGAAVGLVILLRSAG
jgi:DNA repair exonuclease SbcCD ATPase subunit